MLPSRGIVRSLPSGSARVLKSSRLSGMSGTRSFHNGRQFGSSTRQNGQLLPHRPLSKASQYAPATLGSMTATRQLSLWGWGSQKAPEEATQAPASAGNAASTTATPPVTETATEASVAEPSTSFDASAISDIITGEDILNMPEQLGYLHAIGLDYGWGPTSVMQWVLEHVHVWTGLGWGSSLVATAFLLRAVMTYPHIRGLQFSALMQEMKSDPRSKEATELTKKGMMTGDMEARQRAMYLQKNLKQEYGVKMTNMLWTFCQIPFTFGLFRILNGMVHVPVPSMQTGGFLWFTDLTLRDPYFILPAAATGLMISSILITSKWNPPESKKMLKPMMYAVGGIGFVCTIFLSSAVNLMGASFAAATLIFSSIVNTIPVRSALGLPTVPPEDPNKKVTYEAPRAADAASASSQGMRERLTASLNDAKKGFSDQMSNYTGTYSSTEQEKAEKKRKELMRKLEENRKTQEREEFEKKYKGKQ